MTRTVSASASELAYPLSTLSSVNSDYNLQYDDFLRQHSRWDRKATLHFREQEPIVLEIRAEARQETDTSRFVDAVLRALALAASEESSTGQDCGNGQGVVHGLGIPGVSDLPRYDGNRIDLNRCDRIITDLACGSDLTS